MKTILVPTDFSKPAEWALEVATGIAKRANGQIILLHVVEQPGSESFNAEGQVFDGDGWEDKIFTLKLIERNKQQLNNAAMFAERAGVNIKTELRLGNPYHGIRANITERPVDLIVMGTSSHSNAEEILIGSNTEKVVRRSKCPVLTVHQKPRGDMFANIVYASSLNDNEKEFADVVKNAQVMYNAKVHLVHINTPGNFQPDHVTKRVLENFAKKVKLENFTMNIYNDRTEEDGILRFAASIDADLIAMATHGRTGFAHVMLGSIAENIVNHSSRPILTYVVKEKV